MGGQKNNRTFVIPGGYCPRYVLWEEDTGFRVPTWLPSSSGVRHMTSLEESATTLVMSLMCITPFSAVVA